MVQRNSGKLYFTFQSLLVFFIVMLSQSTVMFILFLQSNGFHLAIVKTNQKKNRVIKVSLHPAASRSQSQPLFNDRDRREHRWARRCLRPRISNPKLRGQMLNNERSLTVTPLSESGGDKVGGIQNVEERTEPECGIQG